MGESKAMGGEIRVRIIQKVDYLKDYKPMRCWSLSFLRGNIPPWWRHFDAPRRLLDINDTGFNMIFVATCVICHFFDRFWKGLAIGIYMAPYKQGDICLRYAWDARILEGCFRWLTIGTYVTPRHSLKGVGRMCKLLNIFK